MFIKGNMIKRIMIKLIYHGREEGLYVLGTFYHYMKNLEGIEEVGLEVDGINRLLSGFWHLRGITIKALHSGKPRCYEEKPVRIIAFGDELGINNFERMLNIEAEKLRAKAAV